MSIRLMSDAWCSAKLGGSDLLMLLAMADFANDDGVNCWPSVATLASKVRVSDRQAIRVIKKLSAEGYVEVLELGGGRKSNRYKVYPKGNGPRRDEAMLDLSPQPCHGCHPTSDMGVTQSTIEPSLDPVSEYTDKDVSEYANTATHPAASIALDSSGAEDLPFTDPPEEKEETPAPGKQKKIRTLRPETQAHNEARSLARAHFEKVTGLVMLTNGNAKGTGALWWAPLREMCVTTDWDIGRTRQLISAAYERLQKGGCTVSDPNSILKTARAIVAEWKSHPPPRPKADGMVMMGMLSPRDRRGDNASAR